MTVGELIGSLENFDWSKEVIFRTLEDDFGISAVEPEADKILLHSDEPGD